MNETRVVELRRDRGWTQERLAALVARALEVPVRDLAGAGAGRRA